MRRKIVTLSVASAVATYAATKLYAPAFQFFEALPSEVKLATMVGITVGSVITSAYAGKYLLKRAKGWIASSYMRQPRIFIEGYGTYPENLLLATKTRFMDKILNDEIKRTTLGFIGRPIEKGEVKGPRIAKGFNGFALRSMDLAAGQTLIRSARATRESEKPYWIEAVQQFCGIFSFILRVVEVASGITSLTATNVFPTLEIPDARLTIVTIVGDREEVPGEDSNQDPAYVPQSADATPSHEEPMVVIKAPEVVTPKPKHKDQPLTIQKLEEIHELAWRIGRIGGILVLSQNIRGYENEMRRLRMLILAASALGTRRHAREGIFEPETEPVTGFADIYHWLRCAGVYAHSEVKILTGTTSINTFIEDVEHRNLRWMLDSFNKDIDLSQRKAVVLTIVGNPTLVSQVIAAFRDILNASSFLPIAHPVEGARAAYCVLYAALFPSEVEASPFPTATAWMDGYRESHASGGRESKGR